MAAKLELFKVNNDFRGYLSKIHISLVLLIENKFLGKSTSCPSISSLYENFEKSDRLQIFFKLNLCIHKVIKKILAVRRKRQYSQKKNKEIF